MSEWTDIGEQLQKARESMDLELMDVAHSTRIPLATLKALEESDYSIFPSPTYARSFLSQYSEFLKVDAHEWVNAFETGDVLSNVNDHGYLQAHSDHIGGHESEPANAKSSSSREDKKVTGGGSSLLQTFTVFFITALLIGGGIYAYQKFEPMFSKGSDTETAEETQTPSETVAPSPKVIPSPPVENTPEEPVSKDPVTAKTDSSLPAPELLAPTVAVQNKALPETPDENPVELVPVEPEPTRPRSGPPPKAMVIEEEDE